MLADLDFNVVSKFLFIQERSKLNRTHLFCNRSDSRTDTGVTMEATASSLLMGLAYKCACRVKKLHPKVQRKWVGTKWASAFKLGISAAPMGLPFSVRKIQRLANVSNGFD